MSNVLITGATGGIGYELAKLFAKNKYNLVLIARNQNKLNEIAVDFKKVYGVEVTIISKNLSDPTSAQEVFNELSTKGMQVDILVNNAGFGSNGKFVESELANELDMINLNITTLVTLTKLFLPQMVERKNGKILNIASTAAFVAGAYMAIYYASKAFVLSFSEAIASELKGTGVTVTCVCPGPTSTGFQRRASIEKTRLLKAQSVMKAEDVAKIAYKALMKGKTVKIPGLLNKIIINSLRFAPRAVPVAITKWLNT